MDTTTKAKNKAAMAEHLIEQYRKRVQGDIGASSGSVYGIIDPDYARIFTKARIVAWSFGYACLAHGSFTRDMDLLLVPWTERAGGMDVAEGIVQRIADVSGLTLQGPATDKPHGRKAWTLLFPTFGDPRWVDVSAFSPNVEDHGHLPAKKEAE